MLDVLPRFAAEMSMQLPLGNQLNAHGCCRLQIGHQSNDSSMKHTCRLQICVVENGSGFYLAKRGYQVLLEHRTAKEKEMWLMPIRLSS
jgi:hypothetical protein